MLANPTHRRAILRTLVLAGVLALASAATPLSAHAEYKSTRAAHPLRIAAYVLHPFGYALDRLIVRPAWALGQTEPFRSVFGVAGQPPLDEETEAASEEDTGREIEEGRESGQR